MNKETEFGGNLRVQMDKNEKALIILGHNECIFKQNNLTKKSWLGPDGKTVLVPKDDGQLEDCADVLNVLYPQSNFLFLFDHSFGHDKQPEDALNVENMSKLFRGKQSIP